MNSQWWFRGLLITLFTRPSQSLSVREQGTRLLTAPCTNTELCCFIGQCTEAADDEELNLRLEGLRVMAKGGRGGGGGGGVISISPPSLPPFIPSSSSEDSERQPGSKADFQAGRKRGNAARKTDRKGRGRG